MNLQQCPYGNSVGEACDSGDTARGRLRRATHARAEMSDHDGTRVDLRRVLARRRREARLNLVRALPHPHVLGKLPLDLSFCKDVNAGRLRKPGNLSSWTSGRCIPGHSCVGLQETVLHQR